MTMTAQPALAIAGLQPPATQAHFLAVDLWALTKQDMTSLISQVSTWQNYEVQYSVKKMAC